MFGDLTTRVVEPLIDLGFGPKDLAKFFSAVQVTVASFTFGAIYDTFAHIFLIVIF